MGRRDLGSWEAHHGLSGDNRGSRWAGEWRSWGRGEGAGGTEVPQRSPPPVSSRCLSDLSEKPAAQSASGSLDGAGLTQRSVKGAVGEVVQSSDVRVREEYWGLSLFPTGTQGLS